MVSIDASVSRFGISETFRLRILSISMGRLRQARKLDCVRLFWWDVVFSL